MVAGEGLTRLDGGSLTAGFLILSKKWISNGVSTMKQETVKDYLDFGRLIVAVVSDGVSSSALC
jgi:hypothetical protein